MSEKQSDQKRRIGDGLPGPGRKKGIPNRATTEFRETVRKLLEDNADNVAFWLSQVATGSHGKDPAPEKALDLLAKLAEYAAPKLSRQEVSGIDGAPLQVQQVRRVIVDTNGRS